MLESEMKLSARSRLFISDSAFNQVLRSLFFLQFRNGSRFPHPSSPSCAARNVPDISQWMFLSANPEFSYNPEVFAVLFSLAKRGTFLCWGAYTN